MYSDVGFDLDGAMDGQPTGTSKLCLSCHDGTVAVDSFGDYIGQGNTYMSDINPDYDLGTDLRGTHPISIVYDNNADPNLWDPNNRAMGTSGYISDVLQNGKVQCSSCHDVHDQESAPNTHLLRVDNAGSQLCLTCHIK